MRIRPKKHTMKLIDKLDRLELVEKVDFHHSKIIKMPINILKREDLEERGLMLPMRTLTIN